MTRIDNINEFITNTLRVGSVYVGEIESYSDLDYILKRLSKYSEDESFLFLCTAQDFNSLRKILDTYSKDSDDTMAYLLDENISKFLIDFSFHRMGVTVHCQYIPELKESVFISEDFYPEYSLVIQK